MMLLAPKTRWAMVNLAGSVGGKYGAKTHFSAHLRLKILQAAQGLITTGGFGVGGGVWGGDEEEEFEDWEPTMVDEVVVVVVLVSVLLSISIEYNKVCKYIKCVKERRGEEKRKVLWGLFVNANEGINRPINLPLISGERRHDVRNFENDFYLQNKK